ncbi:MAG: outer membrane lipoprotein-sorting protein [bacterium]|nr:outer membrane lipoprotein-sorting protein [bacterium]
MKRAIASFLGLLAMWTTVSAEPDVVKDAADPSPHQIVQAAFDRMFNYPSVRSVTLRIHRHGDRVTYRSFDVVYKKIDGRGRTLLRFTEPPYLRGNTLLIIEEDDGRNDTWVYQRELRRPRRVLAGHKGDSFYGSDLSFEDLEHHDWRRYELRRLPDAVEQGKRAFVVEATTPDDSQYAKVIATVERDRLALLRLDLFKAGSGEPIKSLEFAANEIEEENGILKPDRMWVRQRGRDAATEVIFKKIEDDPQIADSVFATMRLERSGEDLYRLVERLRKEAPTP